MSEPWKEDKLRAYRIRVRGRLDGAWARFTFRVPDALGRRVARLELDAGELGRATLPVVFEVR